jgi:hypothetical protein
VSSFLHNIPPAKATPRCDREFFWHVVLHHRRIWCAGGVVVGRGVEDVGDVVKADGSGDDFAGLEEARFAHGEHGAIALTLHVKSAEQAQLVQEFAG